MLIALVAFTLLCTWYLLRQPPMADMMANWIERVSEVAIRFLRAHAAAQRAADAAYREEWKRRWGRGMECKKEEAEYWDRVADGWRGI